MSEPEQPGVGWGPGYEGQAWSPPPPGTPAAPPGPPQYGTPQYGTPQYGTPQYGAPQYGAPPGPGAPPPGGLPPGWHQAPVQRGIVPLRPLGLGEIYDGAFRAVRSNPAVMFGVAAVVVALAVVVQTIAQTVGLGPLLAGLEDPDLAGAEFDVTATVSGMLAYLGTVVVSALVVTVLSGLLIVSVSRSVIGQKISIGEFWAMARGKVWRLLGLTLLLFLATALATGAWIALVVVTIAAEQWAGLALVGLGGGLALLVGTLWFTTRTLLTTPALVLEDLGVIAGLVRGWRLSRGSFWRLLGISLLTQLIVGVVAQIITGPASALVTLFVDNPLTDPVAVLATALTTLIAQCLTVPFVAGVTALLYIDVRIRREGLDVELARAAEALAAQGAAPGP